MSALSLLSIASHHRDYRSHNSLAIHNCRVVSRNLPAPLEQRVLAFASGTRVVVRDLFGSMPVRVKQRAIEVERSGTSRDFDQLLVNIVALLLPWRGDVTVTLQDSHARRTVSLQASGTVDWGQGYQSTAPDMLSRTTTLLAEASMVDNEHLKSWVPIGATASGVSIRGCVSLQPVATKRVQFIAIGIQPLLNEQHANILYEDVNRVFEDSSFGVIEEAGLDEDGRPAKTQGFTGKELKPKRGLDRWPMFFLQIMLSAGAQSVGMDELLDERHRNVAVITDLLQVMAYEFLKKHHFRPRSISAMEKLKRPKEDTPALPSPPSRGSSLARFRGQTPPVQQPPSRKRLRTQVSSQHSRTRVSEKRLASPFMAWSRTKSSVGNELRAKDASVSHLAVEPTPDEPRIERKQTPALPRVFAGANNPLFDKAGGLLRKPFDDTGEAPATPSDELPVAETPNARETVLWVDPMTKIKSLIDPRTGFAVKPGAASEKRPNPLPSTSQEAGNVSRVPSWKIERSREQNSVFQQTESRITQVLQASETLGCQHGGNWHKWVEEAPSQNMLATLKGRISKTALRNAEIVAQVDGKFILAKAVTESPEGSTLPALASDGMLILIDQHAADERYKVESLLNGYFVPDPSGSSRLMAQTHSLDKPLRFDLSRQDGELLVRFRTHFAHWGVGYEVVRDDAKPEDGVTVEVQTLPSSILERCRLEPRLVVDLLRKEIWKLHAAGSSGVRSSLRVRTGDDWVTRFHDCPEGILDLINSRACRSKCSPWQLWAPN